MSGYANDYSDFISTEIQAFPKSLKRFILWNSDMSKNGMLVFEIFPQ